MAEPLTREHVAALDDADPLAGYRGRFAIDEGGPLYLDGGSLGRLPHAAAERVQALVAEWGERLSGGWESWDALPAGVGDRLAEHVLGARTGEVVVCDSVEVNLYKLASAVLEAQAGPVVGVSGEVPAGRHLLHGLARHHGVELRLVSPPELRRAADGARLVCVSHVDARSGEVADMAALRPADGVVLWDLSHSAGAVELDLERSGADLAVGSTSGYLNAGPGAPAYLYVRGGHQPALRPPIQGRQGSPEGAAYDPAEGVARFVAGPPQVLGLGAVEASVELIAGAGMPVIAAKTRALTELFIALHDAWLAPLGFRLGSPRTAIARGAFVALRHADAASIAVALRERAGVVAGLRPPDTLTFAFPALYTRFVDVYDAAVRAREVVA